MDFKIELKKLSEQMRTLKSHGTYAEMGVVINDNYYSKDVVTAICQHEVINADQKIYNIGLKYSEMELDNRRSMSLSELMEFKDIAEEQAKALLLEYGIKYPLSFEEDPSELISKPKESLDSDYDETLSQVLKHLTDGVIDEFIKKRLELACKYLYDKAILYMRYWKPKDKNKTRKYTA